MIPIVATIDDTEMIRDGGSWYITVTDIYDRIYTLFSKVEIEIQESGEWLRTEYHKPVMTNELIGSKAELEWHQAFKMLDKGKVSFDNEIRLQWFNDAKELFQNNGEIPERNRYVGT